jgi:hypothetical protein
MLLQGEFIEPLRGLIFGSQIGIWTPCHTEPALAKMQTEIRKLRQKFAELHEASLSSPLTKGRGIGKLLTVLEWELAALMGWSPRHETASDCQSGEWSFPLTERGDNPIAADITRLGAIAGALAWIVPRLLRSWYSDLLRPICVVRRVPRVR